MGIREEIFEYAKENFGSKPEFLWQKDPNSAVLRNNSNFKWYAIVMNVSKEVLGLKNSGKVDILNVKCDPVMISSLVDNKRYFRAYHMNKEHWITLVLDGKISKEEIFGMINLSFEIVDKRRKRK